MSRDAVLELPCDTPPFYSPFAFTHTHRADPSPGDSDIRCVPIFGSMESVSFRYWLKIREKPDRGIPLLRRETTWCVCIEYLCFVPDAHSTPGQGPSLLDFSLNVAGPAPGGGRRAGRREEAGNRLDQATDRAPRGPLRRRSGASSPSSDSPERDPAGGGRRSRAFGRSRSGEP